MNHIGRVIILVHDYDEAFAFYEQSFDFKKIVDYTENGQRFLYIGPGSKDDASIWLLKADTKEQKERVGNQTSGQPTLVIYTTSLDNLYQHLNQQGVKIKIQPVRTQGYKFFHCHDLYGNEIVVVELKKTGL